MEKLTVCRICLIDNINMYEVASKNLQKMYEKLADIPLVTEDCRPMLACFFCYTKLKQCYQLQRKCLKAEEVFAQMLNGDYKQIPFEFQREIRFCGGFSKTPIQHISIDDVSQTESGAISEQLPAVCVIKNDIDIKEEYLNDEELEAAYLEESYPNREDVPSHHSQSDSDDDVPIMKLKIEVEEEKIENQIRAPVAKKPELEVWKVKQEVTIIDKQKKNGLPDTKITRNRTSKSVTKFRERIMSDTIAKPKVNNRILNKDMEISKQSRNKQNVTKVKNTAIDTNYRSDDINNKRQKQCKRYKCDICQRSFNKKNILNGHIRIHNGEKPYECDICKRSFTRYGSFKMHNKKHTGEKPYKCDICPRSYYQLAPLKVHARLHNGERPYVCDICQHSFNLKGNLKKHILTHLSEKPHKCDICQRSFTLQDAWKQHVLRHTGVKPFKCDMCQRSFFLKKYLNTHILTHTREKPYECDICQHRFYAKSSLYTHFLTHTGKKPYKCDTCQRSFSLKCTLTNHILTHTGEKPYKCDICQRSFSQKGSLNTHILTHTGEKPYKCDICQHRFLTKSALNQHHFTHTGEKPFKCDTCQRCFGYTTSLKTHMMLKHW